MTRATDLYAVDTALRIKGEREVLKYRYATVSGDGMVSLHLVGEHGWCMVRPERVRKVGR